MKNYKTSLVLDDQTKTLLERLIEFFCKSKEITQKDSEGIFSEEELNILRTKTSDFPFIGFDDIDFQKRFNDFIDKFFFELNGGMKAFIEGFFSKGLEKKVGNNNLEIEN